MGSLAQKNSGAIRCSCNTRFRRVPEPSGAVCWWGSGGFRCRWLTRFRTVPGQLADEVPEGSGADSRGVDSKSFCLSLESWILHPRGLDSRRFCVSLESWILNSGSLGLRSVCLAIEEQQSCKKCLSRWPKNALSSSKHNTMKFASKVPGGEKNIEIHIYIYTDIFCFIYLSPSICIFFFQRCGTIKRTDRSVLRSCWPPAKRMAKWTWCCSLHWSHPRLAVDVFGYVTFLDVLCF